MTALHETVGFILDEHVVPDRKPPKVVSYSTHKELQHEQLDPWRNLPTSDILFHYTDTRKHIMEGRVGLVSKMIDLDMELAIREIEIPEIPTSHFYHGQWSLGLPDETPEGGYYHFAIMGKAQLNEIHANEQKKHKENGLQRKLQLDIPEGPMRKSDVVLEPRRPSGIKSYKI